MICVDVKMTGCEDEKMICVDVKMTGCEDDMCTVDVKMMKMRRCEHVSQTPTMRRTLRSDALGKKCLGAYGGVIFLLRFGRAKLSGQDMATSESWLHESALQFGRPHCCHGCAAADVGIWRLQPQSRIESSCFA